MKKLITVLATLVALSIVVTGCASSSTEGNAKGTASSDHSADKPNYDSLTVNIGVQGSGGLFGKAREEKWFEQEFEKLGVKIEWAEFQSGPPMTEAMASKRLDFAGLGNMPVVAGQAAGIPFTVISQSLDGKNNVAIIVKKDSSIASIADLKGKKVAVAKGSNAYNFLYLGLKESGLQASDIEAIQLQPDEAQAAFETGGVDAWATWDPYITLNTLTDKGKVLVDGEQLGVLSPSFTIVRTEFAENYPELVTLYLKIVEKSRLWEDDNLAEAQDRYAAEYKIPLAVVQGMRERSLMINIPVSDEIAAELQKTADFQYEEKTIRKQIKVSDIIDNQYIEAALKQLSEDTQK